jgi:hypothetical protein
VGGVVVGLQGAAQATEPAPGTVAAPTVITVHPTDWRPGHSRTWVEGSYSTRWACEFAGQRGERRHRWERHDCDQQYGHRRNLGHHRWGSSQSVWILKVWG